MSSCNDDTVSFFWDTVYVGRPKNKTQWNLEVWKTERLQFLDDNVVVDMIKCLSIVNEEHTNWLAVVKRSVPMLEHVHQCVNVAISVAAQIAERAVGFGLVPEGYVASPEW